MAEDAKFNEAATTLLRLAVAAPRAAALMAAGTAASTVIYFASRVLHDAVDRSVGLYRRSFLANERFGAGRYPAEGVLRAQDFSFRFTVEG